MLKLIFGMVVFCSFLEASKEEEKKICLTMIVKNESRIIERLLNSVKNVVDCVSICDTGSGDNTVEIIENFLKKNKIPGKVYRESWHNFGYNRTHSAKCAQQTLKELEFPLNNTYLLLLDADMILQVNPEFDKKILESDFYILLQSNQILSTHNIRLVKASLEWESYGVTHEYWACKQGATGKKLDTLSIDDREDGGCKGDKYARDIYLLHQGIMDEPKNYRYYFYLALTYKEIGFYDEAIKWFKVYLEKGTFDEETWYAKLMLGAAYSAKNDWVQALQWFLEAYRVNPARAESLYAITNFYRLKGEKTLAYIFAKQGTQIPYPKDQLIFIYDSIYDYKFDEELSCLADQTHFPSEGNDAANRLLLKNSVPDYVKDQAYKNLLNYIENLPDAFFHPIEIEPLLKNNIA